LTNSHKLLRFNLRDEALSIDAELSRGNLYIKHYIQGLALGNQLASTELQPADDLAILAANTFINIWCLTRDQKYIYQAAIILEFALTKSKQSFQSRLILIRIYRILGMYWLQLVDP
jgi:N-terminal acetyltransferase B complex non-catalytic subunit